MTPTPLSIRGSPPHLVIHESQLLDTGFTDSSPALFESIRNFKKHENFSRVEPRFVRAHRRAWAARLRNTPETRRSGAPATIPHRGDIVT